MGNGVTCLRIYGVILKFAMLATPDSHIQREEEREERAETQRHRHRERQRGDSMCTFSKAIPVY